MAIYAAYGSNLDPRSYLTTSVNGSYNTATKATERTTLENLTKPTTNWQLRLELKL